MTKIEAIRKVLVENGGSANWQIIYNEMEKYYPAAKNSKNWQEGIRGVLYRDMKNGGIKKLDMGLFAVNEYDEKKSMIDIEMGALVTEQELLVKVRTMQSEFREKLLRALKFCPITQVVDKRLLVASHIKPWCFSNNFERLDINNGFLLSPLFDRLFDKGLITFSEDKWLIISKDMKKSDITKLGLIERKIERLPIDNRENYLSYHRENIFLH